MTDKMPQLFSGRYAYNGGADEAARANPAGAEANKPSFTLSVDVDGFDALNVVSGTIVAKLSDAIEVPVHFITKVTPGANPAAGAASYEGGGLSFNWPGTANLMAGFEVVLTPAAPQPTMEVTFFDATKATRHGPFVTSRMSQYFRSVVVDVDHENNALPINVYDTHAHPDRPPDLAKEELTLETAYAKAGIQITRSPLSGRLVPTTDALHFWTEPELRDSMVNFWKARNVPDWKMWIFLARKGPSEDFGGLMFDDQVLEPGNLNRQGTAVFTQSEHFYNVKGAYAKASPPADKAVLRELMYNLIHESGHAFNLAHSHQKDQGAEWDAPGWLPVADRPQSRSWMNYPDRASRLEGAAPLNTTPFYKTFLFRFDEPELLFLRHAPESYVEMGGNLWYREHGRVADDETPDPRLELVLRNLKPALDLGEPVLLELRLKVRPGAGQVLVHESLDPSDHYVEVAITGPDGRRKPFLPIETTHCVVQTRLMSSEDRGVYGLLDLTIGKLGFPFKQPGDYRIEVSYTNVDGHIVAAVMALRINQAAPAAMTYINDIFRADIGGVVYFDGTRVQGDVNERLDYIRNGLNNAIGNANPISMHLTTVRYKTYAKPFFAVMPGSADSDTANVEEYGADPERFIADVSQTLTQYTSQAMDSMGHIWFRDVVDTFTQCARDSQRRDDIERAITAQSQMLGIYSARNVVPDVVSAIDETIKELESRL